MKRTAGLTDSTAIITGGTGAIGSSFAKALILAGAKVAVLGRGRTVSVEESVKKITAELSQDAAFDIPGDISEQIIGYTCDTSQETEFQATLERIQKDMGMPNILINAAGGNKGKADFTDLDVDTFKEVVSMNLIGGLVVPSKITAKLWLDKGVAGSIINIASMASYIPLSGVWAYGASKAGVLNLTAGMAKEFAGGKIRVNGIAPGFFVGNQNKHLLYSDYEKGELSPRGESIIGHTPFGRFGSLEELNGALLFLCDNSQSGFITGVTIPVDGGYLIDNI